MLLVIKLALSAALIGWLYRTGEIAVIVVVAPLVGILMTRDVMNLFSGSYYFMRKRAYDSDTRVFKYGYSTQVRMIMYRNRAWFEARPVCEALGHRDFERTIRHYATTDYCVYGMKREKFLSESAVRRLAEISRHPEAPAFLRWFDKEVGATLDRARRRMKTPVGEGVPPDAVDTPDNLSAQGNAANTQPGAGSQT
jgi:prophage antirepressor-like protein